MLASTTCSGVFEPTIGSAGPAGIVRVRPPIRKVDPLSDPALPMDYLAQIVTLLNRIRTEEQERVTAAAEILADQIAADRLVHVYGPGGHSNLAAQEIFFRAGGLMHVCAVLDEGTLLSNGALRSMAIERTPGYGRVVIENLALGGDDVLILVNVRHQRRARRCGHDRSRAGGHIDRPELT